MLNVKWLTPGLCDLGVSHKAPGEAPYALRRACTETDFLRPASQLKKKGQPARLGCADCPGYHHNSQPEEECSG